MAGKITKKGEIVKDYCAQYPKWKDLTLARKVFKENGKDFKDVEAARCTIRYYREHYGVKNRRNLTDKTHATPLTHDTRNQKVYKEDVITGARILILDIETAPILGYVWGLWNNNLGINQIESDWFCLTWAAKWLFEDKIYSGAVTPKEAIAEDDKRIMKGLWELLNQADIVIAHNGQKFDIPKINTRFVIHGFIPPLPYQQIDTLLHIRRQFGFSSNKLDYVNKLLNLPRKIENEGMPLWVKCRKGDKEAIKIMHDYNVGDITILEETYLRLRPWIKPHPNLGLFILDTEQHRCPTCGSNDLKDEGKRYYTTANAHTTMRCNNCGATGRKRLSDIVINERRHLLLSVPK